MKPGDIVEDIYLIEHLLGKGAMGTVWKVKHQIIGNFRALKTIRLSDDSDEYIYERFESEARAAGLLRHRNIVQVQEFRYLKDYPTAGETRPYIIMDYVDGDDLSYYLEGHNDISLLSKFDRGIRWA